MKKNLFSSRNGVSYVFLFAKGAGDCHYNQSAFH